MSVENTNDQLRMTLQYLQQLRDMSIGENGTKIGYALAETANVVQRADSNTALAASKPVPLSKDATRAVDATLAELTKDARFLSSIVENVTEALREFGLSLPSIEAKYGPATSGTPVRQDSGASTAKAPSTPAIKPAVPEVPDDSAHSQARRSPDRRNRVIQAAQSRHIQQAGAFTEEFIRQVQNEYITTVVNQLARKQQATPQFKKSAALAEAAKEAESRAYATPSGQAFLASKTDTTMSPSERAGAKRAFENTSEYREFLKLREERRAAVKAANSTPAAKAYTTAYGLLPNRKDAPPPIGNQYRAYYEQWLEEAKRQTGFTPTVDPEEVRKAVVKRSKPVTVPPVMRVRPSTFSGPTSTSTPAEREVYEGALRDPTLSSVAIAQSFGIRAGEVDRARKERSIKLTRRAARTTEQRSATYDEVDELANTESLGLTKRALPDTAGVRASTQAEIKSLMKQRQSALAEEAKTRKKSGTTGSDTSGQLGSAQVNAIDKEISNKRAILRTLDQQEKNAASLPKNASLLEIKPEEISPVHEAQMRLVVARASKILQQNADPRAAALAKSATSGTTEELIRSIDTLFTQLHVRTNTGVDGTRRNEDLSTVHNAASVNAAQLPSVIRAVLAAVKVAEKEGMVDSRLVHTRYDGDQTVEVDPSQLTGKRNDEDIPDTPMALRMTPMDAVINKKNSDTYLGRKSLRMSLGRKYESEHYGEGADVGTGSQVVGFEAKSVFPVHTTNKIEEQVQDQERIVREQLASGDLVEMQVGEKTYRVPRYIAQNKTAMMRSINRASEYTNLTRMGNEHGPFGALEGNQAPDLIAGLHLGKMFESIVQTGDIPANLTEQLLANTSHQEVDSDTNKGFVPEQEADNAKVYAQRHKEQLAYYQRIKEQKFAATAHSSAKQGLGAEIADLAMQQKLIDELLYEPKDAEEERAQAIRRGEILYPKEHEANKKNPGSHNIPSLTASKALSLLYGPAVAHVPNYRASFINIRDQALPLQKLIQSTGGTTEVARGYDQYSPVARAVDIAKDGDLDALLSAEKSTVPVDYNEELRTVGTNTSKRIDGKNADVAHTSGMVEKDITYVLNEMFGLSAQKNHNIFNALHYGAKASDDDGQLLGPEQLRASLGKLAQPGLASIHRGAQDLTDIARTGIPIVDYAKLKTMAVPVGEEDVHARAIEHIEKTAPEFAKLSPDQLQGLSRVDYKDDASKVITQVIKLVGNSIRAKLAETIQHKAKKAGMTDVDIADMHTQNQTTGAVPQGFESLFRQYNFFNPATIESNPEFTRAITLLNTLHTQATETTPAEFTALALGNTTAMQGLHTAVANQTANPANANGYSLRASASGFVEGETGRAPTAVTRQAALAQAEIPRLQAELQQATANRKAVEEAHATATPDLRLNLSRKLQEAIEKEKTAASALQNAEFTSDPNQIDRHFAALRAIAGSETASESDRTAAVIALSAADQIQSISQTDPDLVKGNYLTPEHGYAGRTQEERLAGLQKHVELRNAVRAKPDNTNRSALRQFENQRNRNIASVEGSDQIEFAGNVNGFVGIAAGTNTPVTAAQRDLVQNTPLASYIVNEALLNKQQDEAYSAPASFAGIEEAFDMRSSERSYTAAKTPQELARERANALNYITVKTPQELVREAGLQAPDSEIPRLREELIQATARRQKLQQEQQAAVDPKEKANLRLQLDQAIAAEKAAADVLPLRRVRGHAQVRAGVDRRQAIMQRRRESTAARRERANRDLLTNPDMLQRPMALRELMENTPEYKANAEQNTEETRAALENTSEYIAYHYVRTEHERNDDPLFKEYQASIGTFEEDEKKKKYASSPMAQRRIAAKQAFDERRKSLLEKTPARVSTALPVSATEAANAQFKEESGAANAEFGDAQNEVNRLRDELRSSEEYQQVLTAQKSLTRAEASQPETREERIAKLTAHRKQLREKAQSTAEYKAMSAFNFLNDELDDELSGSALEKAENLMGVSKYKEGTKEELSIEKRENRVREHYKQLQTAAVRTEEAKALAKYDSDEVNTPMLGDKLRLAGILNASFYSQEEKDKAIEYRRDQLAEAEKALAASPRTAALKEAEAAVVAPVRAAAAIQKYETVQPTQDSPGLRAAFDAVKAMHEERRKTNVDYIVPSDVTIMEHVQQIAANILNEGQTGVPVRSADAADALKESVHKVTGNASARAATARRNAVTPAQLAQAREIFKKYYGKEKITVEEQQQLTAAQSVFADYGVQKIRAGYGDDASKGIPQLHDLIKSITPKAHQTQPEHMQKRAVAGSVSALLDSMSEKDLSLAKNFDFTSAESRNYLATLSPQWQGVVAQLDTVPDLGRYSRGRPAAGSVREAAQTDRDARAAKAAADLITTGEVKSSKPKMQYFDLETNIPKPGEKYNIYEAALTDESGDMQTLYAVASKEVAAKVKAQLTGAERSRTERGKQQHIAKARELARNGDSTVSEAVIDSLIAHAMAGGVLHDQDTIRDAVKKRIESGSAVVGHNISDFDLPVVYGGGFPTDAKGQVSEEARKAVPASIVDVTQDTLAMSRDIAPAVSHRLGAAYTRFTGEEFDETRAHGATYDVEATRALHQVLQRRGKAVSALDMNQIPEVLRPYVADHRKVASDDPRIKDVSQLHGLYSSLAVMQDFAENPDKPKGSYTLDSMEKMFSISTMTPEQKAALAEEIKTVHLPKYAHMAVNGSFYAGRQFLEQRFDKNAVKPSSAIWSYAGMAQSIVGSKSGSEDDPVLAMRRGRADAASEATEKAWHSSPEYLNWEAAQKATQGVLRVGNDALPIITKKSSDEDLAKVEAAMGLDEFQHGPQVPMTRKERIDAVDAARRRLHAQVYQSPKYKAATRMNFADEDSISEEELAAAEALAGLPSDSTKTKSNRREAVRKTLNGQINTSQAFKLLLALTAQDENNENNRVFLPIDENLEQYERRLDLPDLKPGPKKKLSKAKRRERVAAEQKLAQEQLDAAVAAREASPEWNKFKDAPAIFDSSDEEAVAKAEKYFGLNPELAPVSAAFVAKPTGARTSSATSGGYGGKGGSSGSGGSGYTGSGGAGAPPSGGGGGGPMTIHVATATIIVQNGHIAGISGASGASWSGGSYAGSEGAKEDSLEMPESDKGLGGAFTAAVIGGGAGRRGTGPRDVFSEPETAPASSATVGELSAVSLDGVTSLTSTGGIYITNAAIQKLETDTVTIQSTGGPVSVEAKFSKKGTEAMTKSLVYVQNTGDATIEGGVSMGGGRGGYSGGGYRGPFDAGVRTVLAQINTDRANLATTMAATRDPADRALLQQNAKTAFFGSAQSALNHPVFDKIRAMDANGENVGALVDMLATDPIAGLQGLNNAFSDIDAQSKKNLADATTGGDADQIAEYQATAQAAQQFIAVLEELQKAFVSVEQSSRTNAPYEQRADTKTGSSYLVNGVRKYNNEVAPYQGEINNIEVMRGDYTDRLRVEKDATVADTLRADMMKKFGASARGVLGHSTFDDVLGSTVGGYNVRSLVDNLQADPSTALQMLNQIIPHITAQTTSKLEAAQAGGTATEDEISQLTRDNVKAHEFASVVGDMSRSYSGVVNAQRTTPPYDRTGGAGGMGGVGGAGKRGVYDPTREAIVNSIEAARNAYDQSGGLFSGRNIFQSKGDLTGRTIQAAQSLVDLRKGLVTASGAALMAGLPNPEAAGQYAELDTSFTGLQDAATIEQASAAMLQLLSSIESLTQTLSSETGPGIDEFKDNLQGLGKLASTGTMQLNKTAKTQQQTESLQIGKMEERVQAAVTQPGIFNFGRRREDKKAALRDFAEGFLGDKADTLYDEKTGELSLPQLTETVDATGKRVLAIDPRGRRKALQRASDKDLQRQVEYLNQLDSSNPVTFESLSKTQRAYARAQQSQNQVPFADKMFYAASKLRDLQFFAQGIAGIPQIPQQIMQTIEMATNPALSAERTMTTARSLSLTPQVYNAALSAAAGQQARFGGSLSTNVGKITDFIPLTNAYGVDMTKSLNVARKLAAFDPAQGMQGASIALKEFLSGNVSSLSRRFEINRSALSKINTGDATEMLDSLDNVLSSMGVTDKLIDDQANTMATKYDKMVGRLETIGQNLSGMLVSAVTPALESMLGSDSGVATTTGSKTLNKLTNESLQSYGDAALSNKVTGLDSLDPYADSAKFNKDLDNVLRMANNEIAVQARGYSSGTGLVPQLAPYRMMENASATQRFSMQHSVMKYLDQGMGKEQAYLQALRENQGDFNTSQEFLFQRNPINGLNMSAPDQYLGGLVKTKPGNLTLAGALPKGPDLSTREAQARIFGTYDTLGTMSAATPGGLNQQQIDIIGGIADKGLMLESMGANKAIPEKVGTLAATLPGSSMIPGVSQIAAFATNSALKNMSTPDLAKLARKMGTAAYATVQRRLDNDTVELLDEYGKTFTARISNIDAPEHTASAGDTSVPKNDVLGRSMGLTQADYVITQADRNEYLKQAQASGMTDAQAKKMIDAHGYDKTLIKLASQPKVLAVGDSKDRYERQLASLFTTDKNGNLVAVNRKMAELGGAPVAFSGLPEEARTAMDVLAKNAADTKLGAINTQAAGLDLGGNAIISQQARDAYFQRHYLGMGGTVGMATGVAGAGVLGLHLGGGAIMSAFPGSAAATAIGSAGAIGAGGVFGLAGGIGLAAGLGYGAYAYSADMNDTSVAKQRELYEIQAKMNTQENQRRRSMNYVYSAGLLPSTKRAIAAATTGGGEQFATQRGREVYEQGIAPQVDYTDIKNFTLDGFISSLLGNLPAGQTPKEADDRTQVALDMADEVSKEMEKTKDEFAKRRETAPDSVKKVYDRMVINPMDPGTAEKPNYISVLDLQQTLTAIDTVAASSSNEQFQDYANTPEYLRARAAIANQTADPEKQKINDLLEKNKITIPRRILKGGPDYIRNRLTSAADAESFTFNTEDMLQYSAAEQDNIYRYGLDQLGSLRNYSQPAKEYQDQTMGKMVGLRSQRFNQFMDANAMNALFMGRDNSTSPTSIRGTAGVKAAALNMLDQSYFIKNNAGDQGQIKEVRAAQTAAVDAMLEQARAFREQADVTRPFATVFRSTFANLVTGMNIAGDNFRQIYDTMAQGNPLFAIDFAKQSTGLDWKQSIASQLYVPGFNAQGVVDPTQSGFPLRPGLMANTFQTPYATGPRASIQYASDLYNDKKSSGMLNPAEMLNIFQSAAQGQTELVRRQIQFNNQMRDLNLNHNRALEDIARNGMRQLEDIHINYTRQMIQLVQQNEITKRMDRATVNKSIESADITPEERRRAHVVQESGQMFARHAGQSNPQGFLERIRGTAMENDPQVIALREAMAKYNSISYDDSAGKQSAWDKVIEARNPLEGRIKQMMEGANPTDTANYESYLALLGRDPAREAQAQTYANQRTSQFVETAAERKGLVRQKTDLLYQQSGEGLTRRQLQKSLEEANASGDPLQIAAARKAMDDFELSSARTAEAIALVNQKLSAISNTAEMFQDAWTEAFANITNNASATVLGLVQSLDDFNRKMQQQLEDQDLQFGRQIFDLKQAFIDAAREIATQIPGEMAKGYTAVMTYLAEQSRAEALMLSGNYSEGEAQTFANMNRLGDALYGSADSDAKRAFMASLEANIPKRDVTATGVELPENGIAAALARVEGKWALRVITIGGKDTVEDKPPTPSTGKGAGSK